MWSLCEQCGEMMEMAACAPHYGGSMTARLELRHGGQAGEPCNGCGRALGSDEPRLLVGCWPAVLCGACVRVAATMPAELDLSHELRSSSFDFVCINCGRTDNAGAGWGQLALPCPQGDLKGTGKGAWRQ